jgi:hypothetical protein
VDAPGLLRALSSDRGLVVLRAPRLWDARAMSRIFQFVPHPRIAARRKTGPPRVVDVAKAPPTAPWHVRFNSTLAVKITRGVGTMWCAYVFAALALVSLPSAIKSGSAVTLVSWISQTFLQLVLLSIIIVGQNVFAAADDKRAEATYEDGDAVLHTSMEIERHLEAQDAQFDKILSALDQLRHA